MCTLNGLSYVFYWFMVGGVRGDWTSYWQPLIRSGEKAVNTAQKTGTLAAEYKLPLAPARVLSIASHALANQSVYVPPAPIRMPRPRCANQDVWAVVTPKWPKANSQTSALHSYTRTPHATLRPMLYLFVPINCLWPACISLDNDSL